LYVPLFFLDLESLIGNLNSYLASHNSCSDSMFEILKAGGIMMLPILVCSIAAVAITVERFWVLRRSQILPNALLAQVWLWYSNSELTKEKAEQIEKGSPLGEILIACIRHKELPMAQQRHAVEAAGRRVSHEMERYLNLLGTIGEIAPLLGLLGTVTGMIQVFLVITEAGVGDPGPLAGGISEALITTATGLSVGIPTVVAYRHIRRKVDNLTVALEESAGRLLTAMQLQSRGATNMADEEVKS
jgi:biopolymer transport protein ExbB